MLARLFPKSFVMQLQLRVFSCEKKFVAFVACIWMQLRGVLRSFYLIQRWETTTTTATTTAALHAFTTAGAVALPLCQPYCSLSLCDAPSRSLSCCGSLPLSLSARSACFLAALVRSARLACFQFRFQLRRVRQQLQQQQIGSASKRATYKK